MVENYDRLIEGFAFGKCPGGSGYDCNYTYETIKDNENTTKCNSSFAKKLIVIDYMKDKNNDPTSCRQSKVFVEHNTISAIVISNLILILDLNLKFKHVNQEKVIVLMIQ